MIFIEEKYPAKDKVLIQVEGQLNLETLPILEEVCRRHRYLSSQMAVSLDLNNLTHIGRETRAFLKEVHGWGYLLNLPEFLRLELFPETIPPPD